VVVDFTASVNEDDYSQFMTQELSIKWMIILYPWQHCVPVIKLYVTAMMVSITSWWEFENYCPYCFCCHLVLKTSQNQLQKNN